MQEDIIKKQLLKLVDELNENIGHQKIEFTQQVKTKGNMSLCGGNGRMWINPSSVGYDVSLSGKSIEKQLYSSMKDIFGKDCDGFKQTNNNTGIITQPYWRTDSFKLVKKAAEIYSKTTR